LIDFDDPNELVGAVLDTRWRLVGVLGQGGIGVVYEAHAVDGGAAFALKLLRAEFCEDSEIVTRFLSEVQASARVEHPGVAKVFEAVRSRDGTPYLVMELLRGQALGARMNHGRVPVEQAVAIVVNILHALAAAHAAGVWHRDLKPGNVFLMGDSEASTDVKLLDFGIALVVDAAGGMQRKTRTGMLLGTPGYMSPEQIRNIKVADLRCDLWSVGIIFYELLAGVPAFEAENEFARVTKVLTSEPTPIANAAPQFAHWTPFFTRALARQPNDRFQSALEMAAALENVARHGQMPMPPAHSTQGAPLTAQSPAMPQQYPSNPPPAAYPSNPPGAYPSNPPPGAYPSNPPPAVQVPGGSSTPLGGYATAPVVATQMPQRFGGDTAVSAGGYGSGQASAPAPSVEIVSMPKRPLAVPVALVVMIALIMLLLGFVLGYFVSNW
jgi:eukaryotic-like serine/threonine-protein kinase